MMKCTYEVTVQKDGDWYVAWADDVPGAITQGRTLKEVEKNIKDAFQLTLQTKSELKALKAKSKLRRMKVQVEV
jgi:predicted RNase H-like HicB family nuclease